MTEQAQLEAALVALEAQRALLGDAVVDAAVVALRDQLLALARPGDEQRKVATMLFAELCLPPRLTARLEAEQLLELVARFQDEFKAVMARFDGLCVQASQHRFPALFGLPTSQENDAIRAVQAGLKLCEQVERLAAEVEGRWGEAGLSVQVGINTGLVLFGMLAPGDDGMVAPTATGDAMNVASRLSQAAGPGTILISQLTRQQVQAFFSLEAMGPLVVKGKAKPLVVYRVLGEAEPQAGRGRGIEWIATPFVGRQPEFQALQQSVLHTKTDSVARLVTLHGEAGIGKSRLLGEFLEWVGATQQDTVLFRGRTTPQTQAWPYALLRDLFASSLRIAGEPERMRAQLERALTTHLPTEQALLLGHLLGFDVGDQPVIGALAGDARQVYERAREALVHFFRGVAHEPDCGGLLICLEDIHWADDGSLDLIAYLFKECADLPLLIVCLSRRSFFERRPDWSSGDRQDRIALSPLSMTETRDLLGAILPGLSPVPPALESLVLRLAEGNPFYVEEVLKMLHDDGVLQPIAGSWQVDTSRLAAVRVPPTLNGVLQARLDSLPQSERMTLQRAAVIGRIFWDRAVVQLGASAGRSLQALADRGLVIRTSHSRFGDAVEYRFKHALLHEVAYESVLLRERAALHHRVAEWLVAHQARQSGEAALIGEHFERAGILPMAAHWFERAAHQALMTYAPEAEGLFRRALKALGEAPNSFPMRVILLNGLGEVLCWRSHYQEAAECYMAMAETATAIGDVAAQARAWNGLAWSQDGLGENQQMLLSAERAVALAQAAGDEVELAQAYCMEGWAFYRLGDPDAAQRAAQASLTISKARGAARETMQSLNLLGAAHLIAGHYLAASHYMTEALHLAEELGDRLRVGTQLNNLGEIARARGDFPSAVRFYQDALAIARQHGHRYHALVRLNNLGAAQVGLEALVEAEATLREVIAMASDADWHGLAETYRMLADALRQQGKLQHAFEAAQQALTLALRSGQQEHIAAAWRLLGSLATHCPDDTLPEGWLWAAGVPEDGPRTAEACFAQSAELFHTIRMAGARAWTLYLWGCYRATRGRQMEGDALLREARELFDQLEMIWPLGESRWERTFQRV